MELFYFLKIRNWKNYVLATSVDDYVTVRNISCLF